MPYSIDEIIKAYEILVKGIEAEANDDEERAYGGIIRAGKGKLVESIARHMVEIAWNNLNGDPKRLSLRKEIIKIPINKPYIEKLRYKEVRDYIYEHISDYYYGFKTDVHVSIDGNLVMGIECKAYTENAMLKRILVDATLLKSVKPNIKYVLIQLESQLTGDYCEPNKKIIYGSPSTHTLLSYFDVDLNIITLLEGERRVNEPIHDPAHYKSLKKEILQLGIESLEELLKDFL
jgi:hypothetical protein